MILTKIVSVESIWIDNNSVNSRKAIANVSQLSIVITALDFNRIPL